MNIRIGGPDADFQINSYIVFQNISYISRRRRAAPAGRAPVKVVSSRTSTSLSAMAFVRKVKGAAAPRAPPGTRASTNQVFLTSSGVESLDALIGGGIPLGSTLLLREDVDTSYHALFGRYFVSEGIAQGHAVLSISAMSASEFDAYLLALPRNATVATNAPEHASAPTKSASALRSDFGDADAEPLTERPLAIAWQYEKYFGSNSGAIADHSSNLAVGRRSAPPSDEGSAIKPPPRVAFSTFSHVHDLSASMQPSLLHSNRPVHMSANELELQDPVASLLSDARQFLSRHGRYADSQF